MDTRDLHNAVMLAGSQLGARLFRNNVGQLEDASGNVIRYGVCNPGGSDIIGFLPVTITPEMVGQRVAVFVALEIKAKRDTLRPAQANFLNVVAAGGGRCGVCKTVDDALAVLQGA
jgi:hypothetical protein